MPVQMKTPGVYIVEKNAFPPSVVAVETAVPAFVGYTQWAEFKGKPLANVPFKVTSMSEFETAFGGPPEPAFAIAGPMTVDGAKVPVSLPPPPPPQLAIVSKAPAASDGKLSEDEVTAIKDVVGEASVKPASKTKLEGLSAGKAPDDDEKAAIEELVAALSASSVPAKLPTPLTAAQNATLGKTPAADDGKLTQAEADAIAAALPLATLPATQSNALSGLTPGNSLTAAQNTALTKLREALEPEPEEAADSSAPVRSRDLKIGQYYYRVERQDPFNRQYQLWYAMRMFFDNGGGPCWIVSVGDYNAAIDIDAMKSGITMLEDELEPTMLVIPDAVRLPDEAKCIALQQAMLRHCGEVMRSRVAILDIYDGDQTLQPNDPVAAFRNDLGVNNLNFGAAYYPWLNTVVSQERSVTYLNFLDGSEDSVDSLLVALSPPGALDAWNRIMVPDLEGGAKLSIRAFMKKGLPMPYDELTDEQRATVDQVNGLLVETVPAFKPFRAEAVRQLNVLAPASAMAGLYTFVDNSRGVWKAPANVSVNNAVSPCVPISNYLQQDLNVTPMGKSINAIRSFIGEGVLVWGARTLDGNSNDWRYINVRRTMIFLEESCRLAAKRLVFEPNVSGTWVTIKTMIENFLHSVWRQGGLAGAVPEDAYSVHVGLGDTMTAEDILEGILRVTVLVAITRPAEFIEITFQQQLQKS